MAEGGELVHAQPDWRSSLPGEAGRAKLTAVLVAKHPQAVSIPPCPGGS